MTELTSLDLSNNQITDVTPLSKLYSLETLMLDGNPILDTSVLRELERRGTQIDITIYRYPSWDVNQDGDADEADVFLITATITGESPDVNGDGNIDARIGMRRMPIKMGLLIPMTFCSSLRSSIVL